MLLPKSTILRTGFSLAEVIITITLLGFIMMVLFNLYPSSIRAIRHAQHRLEASNFAQSIIETKREGPFGSFDAALSDQLESDDGTVFYAECISVTPTGAQYMKGVQVTVSWQERDDLYTTTKELFISKVR